MASAQPVRRLLPPLVIHAAVLLLCPQSASALANVSAGLRGVRICPPTGAPANLTGLQFERACAVECGARPDCVAAAHSSAEAVCRLADVAGFAAGWRSSDACRSVVNADRLTGLAAAALSPATLAALLVFHNFLLGVPNLAGNRSFAASLGAGAKLTDKGVWLNGNTDSYIEIDTESGNLTKHLGYGSQFTYFAKYARNWMPGQMSVYIQEFIQSASVAGGSWYESRSNINDSITILNVNAQFASDRIQSSNTKSDFLPVNMQPLFIAATFNGSDFDKFFYNGSYIAGSPMKTNFNVTGDYNARIWLGKYSASTDGNMRGYFICWGVATGQLAASQLAEINALC